MRADFRVRKLSKYRRLPSLANAKHTQNLINAQGPLSVPLGLRVPVEGLLGYSS
jgi:hypothetical protein